VSRFVVSPEAREDLKEISRYIRGVLKSPSRATRLRDIFYEQFRLLAAQPHLGEARNDLGSNVRQWTVGDYVVLYEPKDKGVDIIQIVHSARDLPAVRPRSEPDDLE
jgi:toxin ParE1/3/4